jgi:magnesium-transporting ATPase (P-type)
VGSIHPNPTVCTRPSFTVADGRDGVCAQANAVPCGQPQARQTRPCSALGARWLPKEGVLTRRINATETLGAATVWCSDKTGTLTENCMTVMHQAAGGVGLNDRLVLDKRKEGALPEAFHTLVEVTTLASVVDPFDAMEKAFHQLDQRFLAHTEHVHRDWRSSRLAAVANQSS